MGRKRPDEWRLHPSGRGPVRLIVEAEGYVMARRPGCAPFVLSVKEWRALEPIDRDGVKRWGAKAIA